MRPILGYTQSCNPGSLLINWYLTSCFDQCLVLKVFLVDTLYTLKIVVVCLFYEKSATVTLCFPILVRVLCVPGSFFFHVWCCHWLTTTKKFCPVTFISKGVLTLKAIEKLLWCSVRFFVCVGLACVQWFFCVLHFF